MSTTVPQMFCRNDVLLDSEMRKVRLLEIVRPDSRSGRELAWLIHLDDRKALPFSVPNFELHKHFSLAPLQKGSAQAHPMVHSTSEAARDIAERAFSRISTLVDNPAVFEPSRRNALIQAVSKTAGGGAPNTILKDLRRWWQGGQNQDALAARYSACGRIGVVGTDGRGRKSNNGRQTHQLEEKDIELMKRAAETWYLNDKRPLSLAGTLQQLHQEHYTYVDGNGDRHLLPLSECPSYRQFQHFVKSNYTLAQRMQGRKGEKRFAQEDRGTSGSIQIECHGSGHIYELDATIVDVLLVSSLDRAAIVGKPTLYLIIDRHSRLIVGFYIGFENASYSAAMEAILSIGEDKEALCSQLGLPYEPSDWPAHGILPQTFLADQGELMHRQARRVASSLRTTISNVPGLRPDWKPLVECGFKMIHQILSDKTPAYTPDAEARKRRGINRDRDACLNLAEFTKLIVAAIISHNRTMQAGYPLTPAQVADRVRPIPVELWAHSIQRGTGLLDRMDHDRIRFELMPRDKATITSDGIRFKGLFYSCDQAQRKGWFVDGRRKRTSVEIAFDYRRVDEILVFDPNGKSQVYTAQLTKDSVRLEGTSFADAARHFAAVKSLTSDASEVHRDARYEYQQLTEPTIARAKSLTREATKGRARSSRKKDTAEARALERDIERNSRSVVHAASIETTASAHLPEEPNPASGNVVSLYEATSPTTGPAANAEPKDGLSLQLQEFRQKLLQGSNR